MCEKCADNRELCEQISERMNTAERVREYYRRQGEEREQERIIKLLEKYEIFGVNSVTRLMLDETQLIAIIKGETNG